MSYKQINNIDQNLPTPNVRKISGFPQNSKFIKNSLKLLHLNAQSIRNKLEKLNFVLKTLNIEIDLIAVTETWLKSGEISCLNVNSYNTIAACRLLREGGGVCLLIQKTFHIMKLLKHIAMKHTATLSSI